VNEKGEAAGRQGGLPAASQDGIKKGRRSGGLEKGKGAV